MLYYNTGRHELHQLLQHTPQLVQVTVA
jgi:hypothetical protein